MTAPSSPYSWMPPAPLRDFEWMPGELEHIRKKPDLDCAQWSEQHRVIRMSSIQGLWRHENAPYFKFPMEVYSLPWTREIRMPKGSQLGGTEFIYNTHGYDADTDPGPTLIVMPSKDTVQRVSLDRIQPMYEDCAPLRRLKSRNPDDTSTTRIKLRHAMTVYFGWAGSDSILASNPIKHLKIDEADLVGRRAINLARARYRTYLYEYKVLEVSKTSVADGPIWQDFQEAHVKYDYYVPCPHCGHEQVMRFGQIRWPVEIQEARVIEATKNAWYECEACTREWREADRDIAVRSGLWKPRTYCLTCHDTEMVDGRCPVCSGEEAVPLPQYPEIVGFHLPAFYSRFVPFFTIVADYLRMQADPTGENMEKFWCDDCALPMPEDTEGESIDEKFLYDRREEYAPKGSRWEIPMAACFLTAFADVQGNRLEVEVRAWGPGKETWGIEHVTIPGSPSLDSTWDELEKYLHKEYLHESGVRLQIYAMGIDSGGHHTDEVYKFARKWRRRKVYATKGANTPGKPIRNKPSQIEKYRIPLYTVGTEAAKDTVLGWLNTMEPGPRYQHFPLHYGYEYFRQLCSEIPYWDKDKGGRPVKRYKLKKGYKRNEALDLFVGNVAVFEICNVNLDREATRLRTTTAEVLATPAEQKRRQIRERIEERLQDLPEEKRAEVEQRVEQILPEPVVRTRKKKKVVMKKGGGFVGRFRG